MDSLRVHTSNKSWDRYKELDIEPLMVLVYSPDYNPIEMMFSKLKGIVKRMRLQDIVQQQNNEIKISELDPELIRELNPEMLI